MRVWGQLCCLICWVVGQCRRQPPPTRTLTHNITQPTRSTTFSPFLPTLAICVASPWTALPFQVFPAAFLHTSLAPPSNSPVIDVRCVAQVVAFFASLPATRMVSSGHLTYVILPTPRSLVNQPGSSLALYPASLCKKCPLRTLPPHALLGGGVMLPNCTPELGHGSFAPAELIPCPCVPHSPCIFGACLTSPLSALDPTLPPPPPPPPPTHNT